MKQNPPQQEQRPYEAPSVVDYGSLVDLTESIRHGHHEDGMMKGPDPSHFL
jgi:hypothetical protein